MKNLNDNGGQDKLLISNVRDLAAQAAKYQKPRFTDFLDTRMQDILLGLLSREARGLTVQAYGGYLHAERKILIICPDYFELAPQDHPIRALDIKNKSKQALNHRDYLGSLMSLGIERDKIGDLVVSPKNCLCFIKSELVEFVCLNLFKVGGSGVFTEICADHCDLIAEPEFLEHSGTVNSMRLDAVVALALRISRTKSVQLIEGMKVTLNHQIQTKCDKSVASGDIISVRGFGKFLIEEGGNSKKGRTFVTAKKYV